MSLTVGEVLENAKFNKAQLSPLSQFLGKEQAHNYSIAKEMGANDEDDWNSWEDRVSNYKKD